MRADPFGERFQVETVAFGSLQERDRFRCHVIPPQVPQGRSHVDLVIAADAEAKRDTGIEGELRQRPLAEAVNGHDVRSMKVAQRDRKA